MPAIASAIQSISRAIGNSPSNARGTPSEVCLVELDDNGELSVDPAERLIFRYQYFPETITLNKQINNQTKEIPGGSLPLYQWVSSGEHSISFTAKFSCDMDLLDDANLRAQVLAKHPEKNPDIRSALVWLRRYVLPRYTQAQAGTQAIALTKPPKRLRLYIPNSGIGMYGGEVSEGAKILYDSVVVLMTQCDITLVKFFESGLPRMVEVQQTFVQIAQFAGSIRFPAAGKVMKRAATTAEDTPFFGYKLKPRFLTSTNRDVTNALLRQQAGGF